MMNIKNSFSELELEFRELDMIEAAVDRMVTGMYKVLKNEHEYAMNDGLTESAADEAVRIAVENLFYAMKKTNKEVDNG